MPPKRKDPTSSAPPGKRRKVEVSLATKREIFQREFTRLFETGLAPKYGQVLSFATRHRIPRAKYEKLVDKLKSHTCEDSCVVPISDLANVSNAFNVSTAPPTKDNDVIYCTCDLDGASKDDIMRYLLTHRVHTVDVLRAYAKEHGCFNENLTTWSPLFLTLQAHHCDASCFIREDACKLYKSRPSSFIPKSILNKARRVRIQTKEEEEDAADKQFWADQWPVLLDDSELKEILRDSARATGKENLQEVPCSFCGAFLPEKQSKRRATSDVDISLLEVNIRQLQALYPKAGFISAKPIDDSYLFCDKCWNCVRKNKSGQHFFKSVPKTSWANGCWLGHRPTVLSRLTFVEEMIIARVRCTRCWTKLRAISGPGSSQCAASGNVCFHPQEIRDITSKLPRPINSLYDDIAVVFVTLGAPATGVTYENTPLIARRSYILDALLWLKENNPLYADIIIDYDALNQYTEDGNVPFPAIQQPFNGTINAEPATYTGHTQHDNDAPLSPDGSVPLYASGTADVNRDEDNLRITKLAAILHVKKGGSLLKIASGMETINARDRPDVYAMLWPTLFPYGCGFMDDPIRKSQSFVPLKFHSHVRHLLKLADRRFQIHKSFLFVAHNLILRKKSAYQAKLAVSRHWWPNAVRILNNVTEEALQKMKTVLLQRQAQKDTSPYQAKTEEEADIMKLLSYVNTISSHIPGSAGDVAHMREQLRAIARCRGTPSLFFTLNPADAHHPLVSFFAGKDINIDMVFPNVDSRYTPFQRAQTLAENPIAGSQFFHFITRRFVDIFLGTKRTNKRSVFGRVKSYYGVVEAQNRGSLHIHFLIWLEGALSPKRIVDRCQSDNLFKDRFFAWLESICKLGFPPDSTYQKTTADFTELERKASILSLPPSPEDPEFDAIRSQLLREVLENSAQRHSHSDTCYKHDHRSFSSLSPEERDFHCRFNLPTAVAEQTTMDDDGKITLKRDDPFAVPYNPTISYAHGCNTDCKFIGSGYLGMAMSVYITNYTAKTTLDSATVITAMTSVLLANKDNNPSTPFHTLMMKTLNQISGRRELSAQQVASELLGFPAKYTNERFVRVYWSAVLKWLVAAKSTPESCSSTSDREDPSPPPQEHDGEPLDGGPQVQMEENGLQHSSEDELIVLHPSSIHSDMPPPKCAAHDILYRPLELETCSWWDLMQHYEKITIRAATRAVEAKSREDSAGNISDFVRNEVNEGEVEEEGPESNHTSLDNDDDASTEETVAADDEFYFFTADHPQHTTHVLRLRRSAVLPVLVGTSIPRRDLSETDGTRYTTTMLALFKPWARCNRDPLGLGEASSVQGFSDWLPHASTEALLLMDRFEEQWECRNAADDFSRQRKEKKLHAKSYFSNDDPSIAEEADDLALEKHVVFDLAQEIDEEVGEFQLCAEQEFAQEMNNTARNGLEHVMNLTRNANLYHFEKAPDEDEIHGLVSVTENDRSSADIASTKLSKDRETAKALRREKIQDSACVDASPSSSSGHPEKIPDPIITTIFNERKLIEEKLKVASHPSFTRWQQLLHWQQLAVAVSNVFTLNTEQRRAFIHIVNHRTQRQITSLIEPLRLIIGGPGGAGKSHIYSALKAWYGAIEKGHELLFVAPTGIAADNIGGSTIYSFFALYLSKTTFNAKQREELRLRLEGVTLVVIDECYFVGCRQLGKMSRHTNLALNTPTDSFGALDVVVAGDEYQLGGPSDRPLYSSSFDKIHSPESTVQGQNDDIKDDLHGFTIYRDFRDCLMLKDIVRQQNPRYVEFLNRLRRGNCTSIGEDNDFDYLSQFRLDGPLSISDELNQWVKNPSHAAPLVTYTNVVRDMHNWEMTKAFCEATGQDFQIYHSEDFVSKDRTRVLLTGMNAVQAWKTPIKSAANDLTGRLPLAIGMPVIIVDNVATELGICNGTGGTVQKITYFVRHNRRFAVSIDVRVDGYRGPGTSVITLPAITKTMTYTLQGHKFFARRQQVPVIAGFAFTIHNSQSQSLPAMIAHLKSSASTAASYVLLSRIKCSATGPINLRILGDIPLSKINTHASQQVRSEEIRLLGLQETTLPRLLAASTWLSEFETA